VLVKCDLVRKQHSGANYTETATPLHLRRSSFALQPGTKKGALLAHPSTAVNSSSMRKNTFGSERWIRLHQYSFLTLAQTERTFQHPTVLISVKEGKGVWGKKMIACVGR